MLMAYIWYQGVSCTYAMRIRMGVRCAMMAIRLVSHRPGLFEDACAQNVASPMQGNGIFRPVLRSIRVKTFNKEAAKPRLQTIQKNVRVKPEQWRRLEKEAERREKSPNRLVVELAMEAIERRKWSQTEAGIHLLCSVMFSAQVIIRTWKVPEAKRKSSESTEMSPKPRRNCSVNRQKIMRGWTDSSGVNP